jgi:hypothetical protein
VVGVQREVCGNKRQLRALANLVVEKFADLAAQVIVLEARTGGLIRHACLEVARSCRVEQQDERITDSLNDEFHGNPPSPR